MFCPDGSFNAGITTIKTTAIFLCCLSHTKYRMYRCHCQNLHLGEHMYAHSHIDNIHIGAEVFVFK